MTQKIIQKGAEAIIYLSTGKTGEKVVKDRPKKGYRIAELDERIRKARTKSEAKLLEKASKIINSPKPIKIEKYSLEIPFIEGKKLSEHLNSFPLAAQKKICRSIGSEVAKLHNAGIIHGDLTTSNIILSKDNNPCFIDFGLGFISNKIEDKAVDVHLFKEALEARHFKNWGILFKEFLEGYKEYKEHSKVLEQMKKVEARGRYRS